MRSTASRVLLPIATACALVAVLSACGEEGEAGDGSALRFDLPPYVGVSCELPNSVECDRVGVAVRLRPEEPAQRLEAWLNGRRVAMSGRRVTMPAAGAQGDERRGRRIWPIERTWVFEGFLDDAGLDDGPLEVLTRRDGRWLGEPAVHAVLRLVAHYEDRPAAHRTVRVRLGAGWG